MAVVEIPTVTCDGYVLTFDGRVLEVFNYPGEGSSRFHVRAMNMKRADPDRKGRVQVRIGNENPVAGMVAFRIAPEELPVVGPFLDEVEREMVRHAGSV